MPSLPEATDATFAGDVVARSRAVPVLVDFWAPWCGPCRMLGPVLEKLAPEYAGRIEFVKLNTDENQAVARTQRIGSIPAVKLFKDGAVAAEFVGALPEAQVRAFLDQHCPGAAAELAAAAAAALETGDLDRASALAGDALAAESGHDGALLVAGHVALRRGQLDDAAALAAQIPGRANAFEDAQALLALIELARAGAAGVDATAAAAAAAPDDLAARHAHAAALAGAARWRDALDELLAVVERDKRWNDEAGRKAMLTIFAAIGVRHPTSDEYRRRLSLLL
jgi:putative thioredoxin